MDRCAFCLRTHRATRLPVKLRSMNPVPRKPMQIERYLSFFTSSTADFAERVVVACLTSFAFVSFRYFLLTNCNWGFTCRDVETRSCCFALELARPRNASSPSSPRHKYDCWLRFCVVLYPFLEQKYQQPKELLFDRTRYGCSQTRETS